MATVTVTAPGKVNRRIAGVTFSEGRAEVDPESAAFQFFKRRGYRISDFVPPAGTPLTGEELARAAASEAAAEQTPEPTPEPEPTPRESEPQSEPEPTSESEIDRPHPVQGSKAVWFEYLSTIKPDHGFDLEKVSRKELIEAVEALEKN